MRGKDVFVRNLLIIDDRYPGIQKHSPGIKFMAPTGERMESIKDYEEHIKRSVEYRRRKHKPKIEVRLI